MRYRRVLLFRPNPIIHTMDLLPVGLGILAEQLETAGVDYEVFDLALEGNTEQHLIERLEAFQPDLIGASLGSYGYNESYGLLQRIKQHAPDAHIVAGGPHVSMFLQRVLEECPAIDFGCVKEGEETLMELVEGKPVEEIKGLIRRQNGDVIYNGDRSPLLKLERFGFPKYRKFEVERYWDLIPIYASRGCPYKCIFCAVKDVMSARFRARPVESVIEELEYWRSRGFRRFSFSDDNFTFQPQRIFELCRLIQERGLDDMEYRIFDTRADSTSRELLVELKKSGFRFLQVGVESGVDRVLKIIRKGETVSDIERFLKDATELGFDVGLSFIIGTPYETVEEVEESFRFALKYPVRSAWFFNIIPTPNTEMLDLVTKHGVLLRDPEDYVDEKLAVHMDEPLFFTPEIPLEERKRLLRKSLKVSHMVKQNYWYHRLKLNRFGVFGKLLIKALTNRPMYNVAVRMTWVKSLVERMLPERPVHAVGALGAARVRSRRRQNMPAKKAC